jgi:hypothetical protein
LASVSRPDEPRAVTARLADVSQRSGRIACGPLRWSTLLAIQAVPQRTHFAQQVAPPQQSHDWPAFVFASHEQAAHPQSGPQQAQPVFDFASTPIATAESPEKVARARAATTLKSPRRFMISSPD